MSDSDTLFTDLDDSTSLVLQMAIVLTASPVVGFLVTEYFAVAPELGMGTGAASSVFDVMVYTFFGFLIVVPVGFAYRLVRLRGD